MAALVEEAVSVGDLVRLMTFRQSQANLVEITLPETAPYVGHPIRDVPLPHDAALVAILRGRRVLVPTPDDPLESGDELVFASIELAADGLVVGVETPRHPTVVEPGLQLGENAAVAHAFDTLALMTFGNVGADEGKRNTVEAAREHLIHIVDELSWN